jgi:hypothetical protein
MDGGREGEELEVHVRRLGLVVAVALAAVTGGTRAEAQRYRVLVASESGQRSVVEFRPCIPAEGSGCGAWIDREAVADSTVRLAPSTGARFGPGDSVWVDRGAIRIRSADGRSKTIQDPRGAATTLTLTPMRDYAFVVLRKTDAPASTIVMVDLSTRSVIANCPIADQAYALAVIR